MKNNIFANRNFFLYFLGALVSDVGDIFYNFAISLYILDLTGSASQTGAYLAFGVAINLIVTLFAGAIVDKFNKVKIMYNMDFVRGWIVLITGYFIFRTVDTSIILVLLYIASFIISIASALFVPAHTTLIKFIVNDDKYQEATSIMRVKSSIENIVGLLLASVIYSTIGVKWIFIINGLSFLLSGFSEMFIRVNHFTINDNAMTFKNITIDIVDGWNYFKSKKKIFNFFTITLFYDIPFLMLISIVFPYLINQKLMLDPIYLSFTSISISLASITMGIYMAKNEQQEKIFPIIKKGIIGTTISTQLVILSILLLINFNSIFLILFISLLIFVYLENVFSTYYSIPFESLILRDISENMIARTMTIVIIMSSITYPFASITGGILIDNYGLNSVLIVLTIFNLFPTFMILRNKVIKEM